MLNRFADWKTTATGAAVTGVVWVAFNSLGCSVPPNGWMAWIATLLPVVVMGLMKDKK